MQHEKETPAKEDSEKTVEIETERHVHKKSKRSKKIKSRIYSAQHYRRGKIEFNY